MAAPIANRPAGSITETLSRVPNNAGESPLGDIIADAQLAATSAAASGGAVIAFTNPGGIRIDIARKDDGAVTYADLFASQPFRNQLVTLTLTGKQIKDMLEQQWLDPKRPRILQVSKGFAYAWDNSKPNGERILAERMSLNGAPIDPAANYRVTVNNFLSVGGDGFTVLKDGTAPQIGVYDIDALHAYFQANSPIGPGAANRIRRDELRLDMHANHGPSRAATERLDWAFRMYARILHDTAADPPRLSRPSDAAGTSRAARPAARGRRGARRGSLQAAGRASEAPEGSLEFGDAVPRRTLCRRTPPHRADERR